MSEPCVFYRLATPAEWARSRVSGTLAWSDADRRDGYFHLSTERQVLATAQRHFTEGSELYALEIDGVALAERVKFEASLSGGDELFPHFYGTVDAASVLGARLLRRDASGAWRVSPRERT
jgi:uncharacterized protein (DUF952 family)